MKYTIVSGQQSSPFEGTINRMLNEGWVLYGNPFASEPYCFNQAMTKED